MTQLNETQQTILEQMAACGLTSTALNLMGMKMIILIDSNTLKFHFRAGRKVINLDVAYNYAFDHYDVKVHTIKGVDVTTKILDGMYCDQFGDIFADALGLEEVAA